MQKTEKKFPLSKIRQFLLNHFRPDALLVLSFVFVIIVGSVLLMLPISNRRPITYIDALFTATTSTCVTGLVTRVTAEQYTTFGHFIILLLIQIGGLGFMTFVSIFLVYNRSKLDSRERTLLRDSLNKDNFRGLSSYIRSIMRFTFVTEGLGAFIIYTQLMQSYGVIRAIFPSIFLAVSSFCNAGIDTLGNASLIPYQANGILMITIALLIIAGGLGFAVWFDLYHQLDYVRRGKEHIRNFFQHLHLHSRIVLWMSSALILAGMAFLLIFEYHGALRGLTFPQKLLAAFFNSVTLRTAGFAGFDYSQITNISKIFMVPMMLIGGSPGGTAGGFKTTTFFILLIVFVSQYRGRHTVHVASRNVDFEDVCKAITVIFTYIVFLFMAVALLSLTEDMLAIDLLFEASSAIATVGLTVGITPYLSVAGKIIIIALMLIGRVGPVTIAFMLRRNYRNNSEVRYPHAEILVG